MSRRSSARSLPADPRRTSTVVQDEKDSIALITEENTELAEGYKMLLGDYEHLRKDYEVVEVKYQETQKENVKVKRHFELSSEKFSREKTGLVRQKDDLNAENEKLRKELKEKSAKVLLLYSTTTHSPFPFHSQVRGPCLIFSSLNSCKEWQRGPLS